MRPTHPTGRVARLILALAASASLGSCDDLFGPDLASVEVSPAADTLTALGDTLRLGAVAKDSRGHAMTGKSFTWASSNVAVATVDTSGLVTAIANGPTTITATADAVSGSAALLVAQAAASVTVSPAADTLTALGDTLRLGALAKDSRGNPITGKAFTWASSKTAVATVDSAGLVTAVANGPATITATSDGASALATVLIAQAVATVELIPAADTLTALGDTLRLGAVAKDSRGHAITGKSFTWASSNVAVATVDLTGLVTAVTNGSASVTAETDGVSGSSSLKVIQVVTKVQVSPAADTVTALGETVQLVAVATDARGNIVSRRSLHWSTSDTTVAGVDSVGLVRGVGNGSAIITATVDGVAGTATIVVMGAVRFSGVLRDRDGVVVPNQAVRLLGATEHSSTTATDGSFSLTVAPGNYTVGVRRSGPGGSAKIPDNFDLFGPSLTLSANRVQDLTLQNVFLQVTVQDPDGNPVPNVTINVGASACITVSFELFSGGTTGGGLCTGGVTNSSGVAQLILFPSTSVSLVATPPGGSQYSATTVSGLSVTTDASVTVTLLRAPTGTVTK